MKYFYEKPKIYQDFYGHKIKMNHPIYQYGTLFEQDGKGMIFVQKRFRKKCCYWDAIDPWLANDIYFPSYFAEKSREINFPIVSVRTVMWALRMKPLPKEFWEEYF